MLSTLRGQGWLGRVICLVQRLRFRSGRLGFTVGLTVVNLGLASTVVLPLMTGRGDPRRLVVSAKAVMFASLVLTALPLR